MKECTKNYVQINTKTVNKENSFKAPFGILIIFNYSVEYVSLFNDPLGRFTETGSGTIHPIIDVVTTNRCRLPIKEWWLLLMIMADTEYNDISLFGPSWLGFPFVIKSFHFV